TTVFGKCVNTWGPNPDLIDVTISPDPLVPDITNEFDLTIGFNNLIVPSLEHNLISPYCTEDIKYPIKAGTIK
ncbi:11015_t:CDS:2, partial [Entrophospora sp. SA101]